MKKQLLILALLLFTGFGFYSCEKKYQVIPPPTPTSSIRDSFEFNFNENRQNFGFNATTGGTYVSDQGILFYFPAHAFKSALGDSIFGQIDVNYSEWLDPSEMILQNRATTSNGEVLVTGGFFRMEFTSNTSPVFVSNDTVIVVRIPTDIADPDMNVYYGTEDASSFVNWAPSVDSSGIVRPTTVTSTTLPNSVVQRYYDFTLDSNATTWVGASYLFDGPGSSTELTIGLPERHDNSNTLMFVYFNNFQSIMSGFFNGQNFVTNGRIPAGTSARLVIVSEIDEDYFSKIVPITVSSGFSRNITLDPTTYDDIELDIRNL